MERVLSIKVFYKEILYNKINSQLEINCKNLL